MKYFALFAGLALLTGSQALTAAETKTEILDAVRFMELPTGEAELQTGITTYTNPDGIQVDLISAVHIGDRSYYDALNQIFRDYDVVLYELVGGPMAQREETQLSPELQGIQVLQRMAQAILGFKYQLDGIDYTAANFEHADVTWQEWSDLNEANNEDLASMFFRAMSINYDPELQAELESLNQDELTTDLVDAITEFSPDKLKRSLAPMLGKAELFVTKMEGAKGSVIITERNKVVMKRLLETIGQGNRKIGVFYGAGHMPDFDNRLEALGFTEGETRWLMAWEMASRDAPPMTAVDAVETLLKDDDVIDGIFDLLRHFLEGMNELETNEFEPENTAPLGPIN